MDQLFIARRMMTHPDPERWWTRQQQRLMRAAVQPEDNPSVVTVRPYGVGRGIGVSTFPVDYTMMRYGGTLRGARIGQWKESLLVSIDSQPLVAPNFVQWRPTAMWRFGQYELADEDVV